MNKKKWIAACFIILLSFNAVFIYAQEGSQSPEIRKVIDDFLGCIPFKDLDCTMRQISADYSDKIDSVEIDYAKFKSDQAARIENASKKYIDITFSGINISNLVVKDDKATLELRFIQNAYNTDTFRTESITKRILVSLENKEGGWKITKFRRVSLYE